MFADDTELHFSHNSGADPSDWYLKSLCLASEQIKAQCCQIIMYADWITSEDSGGSRNL